MGTVYVVGWDDVGVTKAGWTNNERWRTFLARGARLLWVEHDVQVSRETEVAAMLAEYGTPAFPTRELAEPWLGQGGTGYTECYLVEPWLVEILLAGVI